MLMHSESTSTGEGAASPGTPVIVAPEPLICPTGSMLALCTFVGFSPTTQSAVQSAVGDLTP